LQKHKNKGEIEYFGKDSLGMDILTICHNGKDQDRFVKEHSTGT
jgi:hypothetical protein